MKVGLVGLGLMGQRFVRRLVAAGLHPRVYDLVPTACDGAVADGATAADSVAALAASVDVVLSSLPMPADVESVVDQALPHLRAGQVWVDLSTIDPTTARRLA